MVKKRERCFCGSIREEQKWIVNVYHPEPWNIRAFHCEQDMEASSRALCWRGMSDVMKDVVSFFTICSGGG